MDARERRRRVVTLCQHFMRNLAFFRTARKFPSGWSTLPLVASADFWRTTSNNFLDTCVLEWCKLLGDEKAEHGWEKIVSDKKKFKADLLTDLKVTEAEFEEFRKKMRTLRDKFIAHLDSDETMYIPLLDLAKASVEFYHGYIVTNEAKPGDLSGLADTAGKLQTGYEERELIAQSVYQQFFPKSD